jgi:hypothetical protein
MDFLLGDIFGLLALFFIGFTAIFILLRKQVLKHTRNLNLLRKIHITFSALGGLFLVLHVAYFVSYPITLAVILGYAATAEAVVVWLTGTAFLERYRDSLFYHGSLSFAAISMMVIHAVSSGSNIPLYLGLIILGITSILVSQRAWGHAKKILKEITLPERPRRLVAK